MYDEPVNLNAIQMIGRYWKEVYLEVDIKAIDITLLFINTQKLNTWDNLILLRTVCKNKQTYRIKHIKESNRL